MAVPFRRNGSLRRRRGRGHRRRAAGLGAGLRRRLRRAGRRGFLQPAACRGRLLQAPLRGRFLQSPFGRWFGQSGVGCFRRGLGQSRRIGARRLRTRQIAHLLQRRRVGDDVGLGQRVPRESHQDHEHQRRQERHREFAAQHAARRIRHRTAGERTEQRGHHVAASGRIHREQVRRHRHRTFFRRQRRHQCRPQLGQDHHVHDVQPRQHESRGRTRPRRA